MKRFIVFLYIITFQTLSAQENIKSLALLFNYHTTDFFLGANYQQRLNKNQLAFGAEFGINRTLFQKRIYPKIYMQFGRVIQFNGSLGTIISSRLAFSTLNVSTNTKCILQSTVEPTFGLSIYAGKKFKTTCSIFYGPTFTYKKTISLQHHWTAQYFFSPEIQFSYDF